MFCPKCNTEIPEGKLYCPSCGEEIIIVSDFDIKLEDNIDTTVFASTVELPDISEQLSKGATVELPDIVNKDDVSQVKPSKNKIPVYIWIVGALICLAIIIGVFLAIKGISSYISYDTQYNKAYFQFENEEYSDALKTAKHVIALDDSQIKGYLLLADIYSAENNYDASIAVLIDVLDNNPQIASLYDKIVACYEAEGDYSSIHNLILSANDEALINRFPDYFPKAPAFSYESGEYISPVPVILSAEGEGEIYYTTDGSTPSKESLLFSDGIPLEEGETIITAVFVNEKGIMSDAASNTYFVKNDIPDVPVMLTQSGSYNVPNAIGVVPEDGLTYYYVSGSGTPTENDKLYEMPLFMPFGTSQYSFIAVNERGESSQSITVDYDLSFAATINKQVAEYAVSYHLLTIGDTNIGYTYVSSCGYTQDMVSYYIIDEMNGNSKTGRIFAVDATNGALFKVSSDTENRKYIFNPM